MRNLKTVFCVLLCFIALLTRSQANLVPNHSFETYTTCPSGLEDVEYTVNWYAPTDGTSDYYDTCYPVTFPPKSLTPTSPTNLMGYQNAFNGGGGYMGLMTYDNTMPGILYREYIQTQLSIPLSAGQKYYVSFYVSLADSSRYSSDGMSAYISQTPITLSGGFPASFANFTVNAQVSSPSGQLLSDAVNWQKISGAFIATGGEQYITIGNFKDNSNTTKIRRLPLEPFFGGGQCAYYYVDEVCVSLSPQTCNYDPSVGIQNYSIKRPSFYYDPQSDRITFEAKGLSHNIKIMDLSGKIVKTVIVGKSMDFLDISDLSPGCFIVWLTDDTTSSVKKILVD